MNGAEPTIQNCKISNNVTFANNGNGGGIYLWNSSNAVINESEISNNTACHGGGISVQFNSNAEINNSCITNNSAIGITGVDPKGGGIATFINGDVSLYNVEITNNNTFHGGGIYGGVSSNIRIEKTLIAGNIGQYGGSVYCYTHISPANVEIVNSTITHDPSVHAIYCHNTNLTIVNSIVWLNSPSPIRQESDDANSIVIDHSDIVGGQNAITVNQNCTLYWLDGNIDSDPLFVDPINNNYELTENSPCIDAGTDYFEWGGEIIVNLTPDQYYGTAPDMGCYESSYTTEPELELYLDSPDTLYVLPGEWWYSQYGIEMSDNTPILTTQCYLYFDNLLLFDDFDYGFNPDYLPFGTTYNVPGNGYHTYTWMCNSGTGVEWWWLFSLYATNNQMPGEIMNYWFYIYVGTVNFEEYYKYVTKYVHTIDGIRGDVNDDGTVTQEDVDILVLQYNSTLPPPYDGKYTASGLNFGRGIVLFSRPDLISTSLLNIYVYNPNDPILQGLGIGELMSTTAYGNNLIYPTPYSHEIVNNQLIITTSGNIVNVMATLEDGEMWQHTGVVENGQIVIDIPDPDLEYSIETKYWANAQTLTENIIVTPEKPTLNQNYPNPFNPSTTISFNIAKAGDVELTIYNIKGQKVKTLVNDQFNSGYHQILWNGKDENGKSVSSGVYFYKMKAEKYTATKKMILTK